MNISDFLIYLEEISSFPQKPVFIYSIPIGIISLTFICNIYHCLFINNRILDFPYNDDSSVSSDSSYFEEELILFDGNGYIEDVNFNIGMINYILNNKAITIQKNFRKYNSNKHNKNINKNINENINEKSKFYTRTSFFN